VIFSITLDIPTMPIDAQMDDSNDDEDLISSDERRPRRLLDHLRQNDADFSDSDDEGEGGRRNHSRYRDKDSIESNGNHKFGIGGGILTSGPANTHGAGPSAHTTAVQILSSVAAHDMDIDTPPSTGGDGADEVSLPGAAPATDTAEASKPSTPSEVMPEEPDTKELADEQMSVDESSKPATSAVAS
jgi:histone deacetylase 1/2